MKNNIVRITSYILSISIILSLFIFGDIVYNIKAQFPKIEKQGSEDFYTLASFGIEVATYNTSENKYVEVDNPDLEKLLLVRTSQLVESNIFEDQINIPYQNIIILCDRPWDYLNFNCNSTNFDSTIPTENIPISEKDDLSIGYIEDNNSRYFILPSSSIENIQRYPNLNNLLSTIASSQHIKDIEQKNEEKIQTNTYIPIEVGMILLIVISNLIFIVTLNEIKVTSIKRYINKNQIPFLSIIPIAVLSLYALVYLSDIRSNLENYLNNSFNFNLEVYPNLLWGLLIILLLNFIFYIGFEFNIAYLANTSKIKSSIKNKLKPYAIKTLLVLGLSYGLVLTANNNEVSLKQINTIISCFILFLIYISLNKGEGNTIHPDIKLKLLPQIPYRIINLTRKILLLTALFFLSIFLYQRAETRIISKNSFLFNPPKMYFSTPYSKLVNPDEVFHEYNVQSTEPIFIDQYIVKDPNYGQIKYKYNSEVDPDQSFAYIELEEKDSIKSLLTEEVLNSLKTDLQREYFRILDKSDLNSKVYFKIKLLCNITNVNSNIYIDQFRLSYDKQEVKKKNDIISTHRRCTYNQDYELTIVKDLKDISTYAYNDEILKISADNKILEINISIEDPKINFTYLNLVRVKNYIRTPNITSDQLLVLTSDENADGLMFSKEKGAFDLANSINTLKARKLISNTFTIDSLNKYTLIKYIK